MPSLTKSGETRWAANAQAILVGVTRFSDPLYAKRPLPQTAEDARGLKKVLGERLGWDPDKIILLTGAVTKADIRESFAALRTRITNDVPCDLFVFLLSTHGHIYDRIQQGKTSTLLASDTLLRDQLLIADTGLTRDILSAYVDSIPARQKVVILDACFASSALSAGNIAPNETFKDMDAAVLSSAIGRSYAEETKSYSLFTGHLIDVLSTLQGEVGLGTVFDSVSRMLPAEIQRPFCDTKARYIPLGIVGSYSTKQQLTYQRLLDFTDAQLTLVQSRYSVQEWGSQTYVSRKGLELGFADYLKNPRSVVFTVTGAAGSGKTTSLLFLAQTVKDQRRPVLWYSRADLSAYPTLSDLLVESLRSVTSEVSMPSLRTIMDGQQPIVVFLDAINEWSSAPEELARFCRSLENVSPHLFRVVLACRDEAWPNIANAMFEPIADDPVPRPSAHLGDFDDDELAEAERKSNNKSLREWPNARNPLFFRILTDLDAMSDQRTTAPSYSLMFSRYLDVKLSQIQDRFSFTPADSRAALDEIMRVLHERGVQTVLAVEFLRIVGDRMGIALLDEGIVRRVGDGVAIENESLHQFLLSRILPPDPFKSIESKDLALSDPWWGAAAIRLLDMQDTRRIIEIMRTIRNRDRQRFYFGSTIYIVNVLGRMPSIEPYKQFVLEELVDEPRFHIDEILKLASSVLVREGSREIPFVLSVIRALFLHASGDWRAKKWSDWSQYNFADRISRLGKDHPAHLLFQITKSYPREVLPLLVSQWLSDSALLSDQEGKIADVAYAFLLNMSTDAAHELVDAVARSAELIGQLSGESSIHLRRVLERVSAQKFEHFIAHLAKWLGDANLCECALTVISSCPSIYAIDAIDAVEQFLNSPRLSQRSIDLALASLGNIDSRQILEYYRSKIGLTELQSGIVRGSASLFTSYPQEVLSLVSPLFNTEVLRRDTLEALELFCRHRLRSVPQKVVPFLARILQEYPGAFGRDIAMSIADCQPNGAITELVEVQLVREADGVALEHLLYYLRNVRRLKASDIPWIRRWVISGKRLFGLLVALGRSEIPCNEVVSLLVEIDKNSDDYLEATANSSWHSEDGEILKTLASSLIVSEKFEQMRADSKEWFCKISDGITAGDALRQIQAARWNSVFGDQLSDD
jgi:hypothetical protein